MNNGIIWSVDLFWNCFTWLSVDKIQPGYLYNVISVH